MVSVIAVLVLLGIINYLVGLLNKESTSLMGGLVIFVMVFSLAFILVAKVMGG